MSNQPELDALLEQTVQRPRIRRRVPPPSFGSVPPISFKAWASSQVAAYRFGLVLGYLATIYFGASAFVAGIPTFVFTTPKGWTPIWAAIIVVGGLTAAIGAIRAGEEPVTKTVRAFNRIELGGAIALFLTLGTYAGILLTLGYFYGDTGRASVGAGFVALGIHPAVRMVWLFFRPKTPHKVKVK